MTVDEDSIRSAFEAALLSIGYLQKDAVQERIISNRTFERSLTSEYFIPFFARSLPHLFLDQLKLVRRAEILVLE